MGKRYTHAHTIKFYECDTTGELTLPMVLNIVIQASEAQSEQLGRAEDYVHRLGYGWVITEHELTVTELPRVNQTINVSTEARYHNKYFCYRHFWLHDESGNELVHIISTFVLMDMTSRKMVSVPNELIEPFASEKITKIRRGMRFPTFSQPDEQAYKVRYLDIDSNQHVNNSKYLDWMVDGLGWDWLTQYRASKVIIRFVKEVGYGQMITSQWEKDVADSEHVTASLHQITYENDTFADGYIEWSNR